MLGVAARGAADRGNPRDRSGPRLLLVDRGLTERVALAASGAPARAVEVAEVRCA
jgi:hypothetical protein